MPPAPSNRRLKKNDTSVSYQLAPTLLRFLLYHPRPHHSRNQDTSSRVALTSPCFQLNSLLLLNRRLTRALHSTPPVLHAFLSAMISDGDLYRLAIFLGSCAMMMIVLYHFLDVNARDEKETADTTKAAKPAKTATESTASPSESVAGSSAATGKGR